jgi:hypothetical protein
LDVSLRNLNSTFVATTDLILYSYAEQYLGIIAANIPCLKGLLEKAFRALGGKPSNDNSDRNKYSELSQRWNVRPRRSFVEDEYHNSLRSLGRKNAAYHYRNDSYEQVLMDAYPLEPKRVRLVDERGNTGKGSRFVVRRVDDDVEWDEQNPGRAL